VVGENKSLAKKIGNPFDEKVMHIKNNYDF